MKTDNHVTGEKCSMCGTCCKGIKFRTAPYFYYRNGELYVSKKYSKDNDIWFIQKNWEVVNVEKNNGETILTFDCKLLTEDNKCPIHENKPHVCSGFPYYGKDTIDVEKLPEGCIFRQDGGHK